MTHRRQLVSSDEAVQADVQHERPCGDCPWARTALNGWLGGTSTEEWLRYAHSDTLIPCHVIDNQQCAGAAIYRANICKRPRASQILQLAADRAAVFASPAEFTNHHKKTPGGG